MTWWAASNMFLEFGTIEGLNLRPGSEKLEAFNVERVRGYLECNLGCKKKEVIHALGCIRAPWPRPSRSSGQMPIAAMGLS